MRQLVLMFGHQLKIAYKFCYTLSLSIFLELIFKKSFLKNLSKNESKSEWVYAISTWLSKHEKPYAGFANLISFEKEAGWKYFEKWRHYGDVDVVVELVT